MNWKVNNTEEFLLVLTELYHIYYSRELINKETIYYLGTNIGKINNLALGIYGGDSHSEQYNIHEGNRDKINAILAETYNEILLFKFQA